MSAKAQPNPFITWLKDLYNPPLHWLLWAVPVAFAIRFVPAWRNEAVLFVVSCIGVIPLAGWMGTATEQLAERVGSGLGGLLNATFGNAAELIISLMALSKGLTGVVKASLTGSIIGNVLLVLGASALAGGLKFRIQKFNKTAAGVTATAMSMAAVALIIPTVFHITADNRPGGWSPQAEQHLSLGIAVVLILTYAASLLFSLKTHRELFAGEEPEAEAVPHDPQEVVQAEAPAHHPSLWGSLALLGLSTLLIVFLSEFLVGSLEAARTSLGLSETFVGVIVVAMVGNAAEHSTAILAALKNKMDLAISISLGSSMQIALFVTPVLVFASYLFGKPLDLEFSLPEIFAIAMAILIAHQTCSDGESNWLEGVQLLSVYAIVAILFFYLPDTHKEGHEAPAPVAEKTIGHVP
jgi:Ca2+:H+ antiporter